MHRPWHTTQAHHRGLGQRRSWSQVRSVRLHTRCSRASSLILFCISIALCRQVPYRPYTRSEAQLSFFCYIERACVDCVRTLAQHVDHPSLFCEIRHQLSIGAKNIQEYRDSARVTQVTLCVENRRCGGAAWLGAQLPDQTQTRNQRILPSSKRPFSTPNDPDSHPSSTSFFLHLQLSPPFDDPLHKGKCSTICVAQSHLVAFIVDLTLHKLGSF